MLYKFIEQLLQYSNTDPHESQKQINQSQRRQPLQEE